MLTKFSGRSLLWMSPDYTHMQLIRQPKLSSIHKVFMIATQLHFKDEKSFKLIEILNYILWAAIATQLDSLVMQQLTIIGCSHVLHDNVTLYNSVYIQFTGSGQPGCILLLISAIFTRGIQRYICLYTNCTLCGYIHSKLWYYTYSYNQLGHSTVNLLQCIYDAYSVVCKHHVLQQTDTTRQECVE